MSWQRIISDSIKAGTVAAPVMIPFGLAFRFPGRSDWGPSFRAFEPSLERQARNLSRKQLPNR